MTTANKITIARIGLIPVFVILAIYHGVELRAGGSSQGFRWAAIVVFVLAAASDGLDGWVARRFNQRSELGVVLDPLADKGLLLAGLVTLSFSQWAFALPVWFGVFVISRDIAVLVGVLVLFLFQGRLTVRSSWTGKVATALQMLCLSLVMLQPEAFVVEWRASSSLPAFALLDVLVAATAFFTAVSGFGYIAVAISEVHRGGHGDPVAWPKSGRD
jgi:CDP-diacylglycerol--glycerol-3-phosphate 3-phosphatidyltransferase